MGRRGFAPKPTALKLLEGNRGHQKLSDLAPENEPRPDLGEPEMPDGLDAAAQREWRRIVPLLIKMGVLTESDGPALASYCETWSTYMQASKTLQDDGLTFMNERTGVEHKRPEVEIVQQCRIQLLRWAHEFGLTPSARSRIATVGAKNDVDEMRDLLDYRK